MIDPNEVQQAAARFIERSLEASSLNDRAPDPLTAEWIDRAGRYRPRPELRPTYS